MEQIKVDSKSLFDFDFGELNKFSRKSDLVPETDDCYVFDENTTRAILMGFEHNLKVFINGYHGSGKSSHVEQVAARLNWPCIRINLDGHITRTELIGRDTITLSEGKQITSFQEGIIPLALKQPIALIIDEYDAGRPDVMFVIQQLLETNGKLTLLEQNSVIKPHKHFRIFATANTIGLGDPTGLYHGTNPINQAQLDRWNIITNLDFMPPDKELEVLALKLPDIPKDTLKSMVTLAQLIRQGFINGDITILMSTRNILNWAQNYSILKDIKLSFDYSFLNKCDILEKHIYEEFFNKCF
ncbi:aerobic cobaltochelatase CobS subunit [endosymbiont of Acanthamoeba sp. UWC8]|uniref:AAA family ATPase n=1 Tax=endosymbiont of Acanthamoeba sp. UWC8 TaxID=86106 RepID=UPI0004D186BA|nr:AAA family ATPase [endosymbiont of Acanthamoeba sp. UWC8]AIF80596.1 aerobic cobaltochelatase CobS subunit [endosymbiont of Acanthamoeba sp. UWC8]